MHVSPVYTEIHISELNLMNWYLMLEGTDAKVHFIDYTPEMEEARGRGEVRPNSFVRLKKRLLAGLCPRDIGGFGDAEGLLTNPQTCEKHRARISQAWCRPDRGWLGRMDRTILSSSREARP